MNLLDFTNIWVKGEVFQGKIMLMIGIAILIATVAIIRADNSVLRGATIPLALIVILLVGYGSFQTFGRPSHANKVTQLYKEAPTKAIEQEYHKALKDDRTYKTLKVVWVILIVVSALLFLVFTTPYLKGLSIGFVALFLTTLTVDFILHYRLTNYLNALKELL